MIPISLIAIEESRRISFSKHYELKYLNWNKREMIADKENHAMGTFHLDYFNSNFSFSAN